MRHLFVLLLLAGSLGLQAQHLSYKARLKVKRIKIVNDLHGGTVGLVGHESGQYRAFLWLRDNASTEELLKLTKHRNGVVRAYAGWALVERKYNRLDEVFLSFLLKPDRVSTTSGCMSWNKSIAFAFYQRLWYCSFGGQYDEEPGRNARIADSLFYPAQQRKLDSILFTRPSLMNSSIEFLYERDAAYPENYETIKALAIKDPYYKRIDALVRYRKAEDLPLIIGWGTTSLPIIEKVHDPVYWPTLKQYAAKDPLTYLSIIASYQDEEALAFLSAVSDTLHHAYHMRLVAEALQRHFTGIYSDLLTRVQKNYESTLKLESVYMPERLKVRMEKMDAYIKKNMKHKRTSCSYEIVDGKTIIKYELLATRFISFQSGVDKLFAGLIREIPDLCETDEIHFNFENRSAYAIRVYKNCTRYR